MCVKLFCLWGGTTFSSSVLGDIFPLRAPMNYLLLDLSKKSLATLQWQSYAIEIEYCLRNYWCKKRQLKQKAQLVFQIYIHNTHIYLNSRALWKKILACFAFIRLSLYSLCICWLDFPPIPFFGFYCINLFEDLLLLLLSRKKCFFYIISCFLVLLNLILNGIAYVSSITSLLFKMSF